MADAISSPREDNLKDPAKQVDEKDLPAPVTGNDDRDDGENEEDAGDG